MKESKESFIRYLRGLYFLCYFFISYSICETFHQHDSCTHMCVLTNLITKENDMPVIVNWCYSIFFLLCNISNYICICILHIQITKTKDINIISLAKLWCIYVCAITVRSYTVSYIQWYPLFINPLKSSCFHIRCVS